VRANLCVARIDTSVIEHNLQLILGLALHSVERAQPFGQLLGGVCGHGVCAARRHNLEAILATRCSLDDTYYQLLATTTTK
jgi:hypothetical protein